MSKVLIYGGGTITDLRSHLGLCAYARGTTARKLSQHLLYSNLYLTFMGSESSDIVTNKDLMDHLLEQLTYPYVKYIIMTAAVCDYEGYVGDIKSGPHAQRLETSEGETVINIKPSTKIIELIRLLRPDIYLVGFKTTTNADRSTMVEKADRMDADLVLVNDTVTRDNALVSDRITLFGERDDCLDILCRHISGMQKGVLYEDNYQITVQLPTSKKLDKIEATLMASDICKRLDILKGGIDRSEWSSKQDGVLHLYKDSTWPRK